MTLFSAALVLLLLFGAPNANACRGASTDPDGRCIGPTTTEGSQMDPNGAPRPKMTATASLDERGVLDPNGTP